MSPLPRAGASPQADPVWTSDPPRLEQSFPAEEVDPSFAESVGTGAGSVAEEDSDLESSVVAHLEAAVRTAEETGMSLSELIGLLFYYAHNLAQEARETALQPTPDVAAASRKLE